MAKISDLQRDLGALKDDVEKLRRHTVDFGSEVIDKGKKSFDSTLDNSKDALKNATKAIQKNPGASIAGAVGLGVVLGAIVKKMFRRKR